MLLSWSERLMIRPLESTSLGLRPFLRSHQSSVPTGTTFGSASCLAATSVGCWPSQTFCLWCATAKEPNLSSLQQSHCWKMSWFLVQVYQCQLCSHSTESQSSAGRYCGSCLTGSLPWTSRCTRSLASWPVLDYNCGTACVCTCWTSCRLCLTDVAQSCA